MVWFLRFERLEKDKGKNMKRKLFFYTAMLLFLFSHAGLAQPPQKVGGFVLGGNIADYEDTLEMQTTLPIRYREYLREVEIKKTDGFKSGLIWYGACDSPGRIVRIKLKYAQSSKKFYNKLLERFKDRFGEPAEWRGDPFHVVIAWKWSFVDTDSRRISLILQHNTMDQEEKMGNAVKMTMTDLIEKEQRCYQKKHPGHRRPGEGRKHRKKGKAPLDWDLFIPR